MNDTPEIAPLGDLPDYEPTENSSLDELAAYALLKQNGIIASDKKNGEDLWLMGQALEWAKERLPHGEWEKWWKAKGFKKTYVWQARTLHNKAMLEKVKELGLTEALRKFDVVPDRKPQAGTTKAAGDKTKKDDNTKATPAVNTKEVEEQAEAPEPSEDTEQPTEAPAKGSEDDGDPAEGNDQPSGDLADEEEKELKEYQAAIRKQSPKARAVVIQHALELLRDDLHGEEVDQELQKTFGQIAQLAEALKGLNSHDQQDS